MIIDDSRADFLPQRGHWLISLNLTLLNYFGNILIIFVLYFSLNFCKFSHTVPLYILI